MNDLEVEYKKRVLVTYLNQFVEALMGQLPPLQHMVVLRLAQTAQDSIHRMSSHDLLRICEAIQSLARDLEYGPSKHRTSSH